MLQTNALHSVEQQRSANYFPLGVVRIQEENDFQAVVYIHRLVVIKFYEAHKLKGTSLGNYCIGVYFPLLRGLSDCIFCRACLVRGSWYKQHL